MDPWVPTGTILKSMAVYMNLSVVSEPEGTFPYFMGTEADVAADNLLTGLLRPMLSKGELFIIMDLRVK